MLTKGGIKEIQNQYLLDKSALPKFRSDSPCNPRLGGMNEMGDNRS